MRSVLATILAMISAPLWGQTFAITGGMVAVGDGGEPIANGTVVVSNGRIVAAGANVEVPADASIVDATGKWVTPGIVATLTQVGLVEVGDVAQSNDSNARGSVWSAAIDISVGFNPRASAVALNRSRGVTRAVIAPNVSTTVFGGWGAVVDLGADMDAVMKARAFHVASLGESGASRAGGSRPAAFAQLRAGLQDAQRFQRNPAAYASGDDALPRLDAQALVDVIKGSVPILVRVERAIDIINVLSLREEFPALQLVLVGASEGWTVAERIAKAQVPVFTAALTNLPGSFETLAATQSNAGRLQAAGIPIVIGVSKRPTQAAGNLVALTKVPGARGLSWGQAFAALSSAPAEVLGLGAQIGSLRPGRRGDVVIWSGDPLELASNPERVWIDGAAQPLETRQTKLRERYRGPDAAGLPKAYVR